MRTTSTAQKSVVPFVGRILLATIFLMSGMGKLTTPSATQAYIASAGLPLPVVAYTVSLVVELGAGLLLLVGYRARVASLVLAVFSVAAALAFHHAFGDQNQMVHFLKNLAMAGGLLQVFAFGAGAYSLDNRAASAGANGLTAR